MTPTLHDGPCPGITCRRCWKVVFDLDYREHFKRRGLTGRAVRAWLDAHPEFAAAHPDAKPFRRPHPVKADAAAMLREFGCCGEAQAGAVRLVVVNNAMVRAGIETQLEGLARHLPRDRVAFTEVVACDPMLFREDMANALRAHGVKVTLGQRDAVRRAAKRADVLLTAGPAEVGEWLADMPTWSKRPRVVFVAHGMGAWTRKILGRVRPLIDHCIAVSKRAAVLCDGLPTTIIHNGIDPARIAPTMPRPEIRRRLGFTDTDTVLAFVGRFSKEKRPHAVIEALARLPSRYKGLLAGYGHLGERLKALARLRCPGRAEFVEAVGAGPAIGDCYSAADALVMCSTEEGFGLVALEAAFRRVPVIATPVGIAPEMPCRLTDGSAAGITEAVATLPDASLTDRAMAWAEANGYASAMAHRYADLLVETVNR